VQESAPRRRALRRWTDVDGARSRRTRGAVNRDAAANVARRRPPSARSIVAVHDYVLRRHATGRPYVESDDLADRRLRRTKRAARRPSIATTRTTPSPEACCSARRGNRSRRRSATAGDREEVPSSPTRLGRDLPATSPQRCGPRGVGAHGRVPTPATGGLRKTVELYRAAAWPAANNQACRVPPPGSAPGVERAGHERAETPRLPPGEGRGGFLRERKTSEAARLRGGFIGSNFVRQRVNDHGDQVVVARQADLRRTPREAAGPRRRRHVVHGAIETPEGRRGDRRRRRRT